MENITNTKRIATSPIEPRSLRTNFLLNNTRLVLNLLIPFVTFPYVSRVLGPESLGRVEYASSIVSYFVLFAAIGIPTYGVREIARVRDDELLRCKTAKELSVTLCVSVLVCCLAYLGLVFSVPAMRKDWLLFLIVAPTILLSDLSFEWFYTGIEDQLFITLRYIAVKVLQVAAIFILIHSPADYYLYAAICVGMNSVSTVWNIVRLKKYQTVRVPIRSLDVKRHLRPALLIFAAQLAVSVYCNLDVTMIGAMRSDREVGLYTAANRIVRILISLVTALGTVMIPRIEHSLKNGDTDAYRGYLGQSLSFVLVLSLPFLVGLEVVAEEVILLFAGAEYLPSVPAVRLLAPIILIVGLAHFVGLQVLYANRQEKLYTVAVTVAAACNLTVNLALIPGFGIYGAIVGTLVAETLGLGVMVALGRKYLFEAGIQAQTWKYLLAVVVMGATVLAVRRMSANLNMVLRLALCVVSGAAVYGGLCLLLKERIVTGILGRRGKT